MRQLIEQSGFAIVPDAVGQDEVMRLREILAPFSEEMGAPGVRNLAAKVQPVRLLASSSAVRSLVEPVLGPAARLVRSIFFNKSPQANWQVAWHQDLAIAVRAQSDVAGFATWSVKDGVVHVQPPIAILEQMLTVRIHLDAADESNGALWVSPGTHRLGRLPASEAAAAAERHGKHLCAAQAGDALILRPLILHASRKAVSDRPRRVIHLEFAGVALPEPLAWAESAGL